MTSDETAKLVNLLCQQVGLDQLKTISAMGWWKANFLRIEFDKASEAVRSIMLADAVKSKDPGKWFAAIMRHTGGSEVKKVGEAPKLNGCTRCRESGVLEVPSNKDWVEDSDGFKSWRGQYTMVVACECELGQMKATQMMPMRTYEHFFPNWRNEYPVKMYAYQQLMAQQRYLVMTNESDKKLTKAKIATLQALQGEV